MKEFEIKCKRCGGVECFIYPFIVDAARLICKKCGNKELASGQDVPYDDFKDEWFID